MTTEFLGYPVPVAYSAGLEVNSSWFTVTCGGSTYVAVDDATPFTTDANFDSSQWKLINGVSYAEMISNSVTSISTIDALREYSGISNGQLILLSEYESGSGVGGGVFQWSNGSTENDDGGFVIQPAESSSGRWLRMAGSVNLYDYGVKSSTRGGASSYFDVSEKVQAAIDRAIKMGCPLRSDFPRSSVYAKTVLYIKKGIDITGVTQMIGAYHFVFESGSFTPVYPKVDDDQTGAGYVVVNMNCTWGKTGKIFTSSSGGQYLDTITTYNLAGRTANYPINGQIHCTSGSIINSLASIHNYGYGVRLADCYDSEIHDIRALFSGVCDPTNSVEKWGVYIGSYTAVDSASSVDESNALTIDGLMAHNCYDLSWYVHGTKIVLTRVHEEATYTTTSSRNNSEKSWNNNSYGYSNSFFCTYGGALGAVSIASDSGNTINHVFTFGGGGCSAATLYSTGDIALVPSPAGNYNGSVSFVHATNFVTYNDCRTTVSGGRISGKAALYSPGYTIAGVNFRGSVTVYGENIKLENCEVMGDVIATAGGMVGSNCNIGGVLTVGGNSYTTKLSNSIIASVITENGARISLDDCNVTKTLTLAGEGIYLKMVSGRCDRITFADGVTGNWQFFPPPQIVTAVDNWKTPTVAGPASSRTINPLTNKQYVVSGGSWYLISEVLVSP